MYHLLDPPLLPAPPSLKLGTVLVRVEVDGLPWIPSRDVIAATIRTLRTNFRDS